MNPLEAAAHTYREDDAARAAELREPIKRARVVSDLYHAADLIRSYSAANNLAPKSSASPIGSSMRQERSSLLSGLN